MKFNQRDLAELLPLLVTLSIVLSLWCLLHAFGGSGVP